MRFKLCSFIKCLYCFQALARLSNNMKMLHNRFKMKTVVLYSLLISSTLMVAVPLLSISKKGHLLHADIAVVLQKNGSSVFPDTASNSTLDNQVKNIKVEKNDTSELLPCSAMNSHLQGPQQIHFNVMEKMFVETNSLYWQVDPIYEKMSVGFQPRECKPDISVAIIVPFRGRDLDLLYLLTHLHPFLRRQQLRFVFEY